MNASPTALAIGLINQSDRCDRCSAQAKVLAVLNAGGELYFCAHHARTHRSALERIAVWIEDHSDVDVPVAA